EAWLDRDQLVGAELVHEPLVVSAAAQEDVLAVVGPQPVSLERVGGAAEPAAGLEQGHLGAGAGTIERRRDPGQATADHDHALVAHDPAPIRLRAATRP